VSTPTPGWYPDPDPQAPPGQTRWYDGSGWTAHVQAAASAPAPAAWESAALPAAEEARPRRTRRTVVIVAGSVVAVLVVLAVVGALTRGGTPDTPAAAAPHVVTKGSVPGRVAGAAPAADPAAAPAPDPAAGAGDPVCQDMFQDVINLSVQEAAKGGGAPTILTIYGASVVVDNTQAYLAGNLPVPAGQANVAVLTCTGHATASDGGDYPINFSYLVDTSGNELVYFEGAS
jgi:hypothetical protein